jgi:hypothetical protein
MPHVRKPNTVIDFPTRAMLPRVFRRTLGNTLIFIFLIHESRETSDLIKLESYLPVKKIHPIPMAVSCPI